MFPAAKDVDVADIVPRLLLDRLAEAGLYGLTASAERGGLGLDGPAAWRVIETLAGGCLATTFVWLQHLAVVYALSGLDTVGQDRAARLAALNASATVTITFEDHLLPDDRGTFKLPFSQWQEIDAASLRTNGSLALGVIGRCLRILGSSPHMGLQWERDLDNLRSIKALLIQRLSGPSQ